MRPVTFDEWLVKVHDEVRSVAIDLRPITKQRLDNLLREAFEAGVEYGDDEARWELTRGPR